MESAHQLVCQEGIKEGRVRENDVRNDC
jgi:hypothetical protein